LQDFHIKVAEDALKQLIRKFRRSLNLLADWHSRSFLSCKRCCSTINENPLWRKNFKTGAGKFCINKDLQVLHVVFSNQFHFPKKFVIIQVFHVGQESF